LERFSTTQIEQALDEGSAVSDIRLISIIDDDESVRESLRMLIDSVGFGSESFASAEEFMDSGRLTDSACLILDVKLPGKSGIDLQEQLNGMGCHIPIIFITAHANERTRTRALQAGAIGFLEKPFSIGVLLDVLHIAMSNVRND
jgi:FixJ family two-component response regulator